MLRRHGLLSEIVEGLRNGEIGATCGHSTKCAHLHTFATFSFLCLDVLIKCAHNAHEMTPETITEEKTKPVRVNIILPADIDELLEQRARSERRSKSAHVAWLIEQDAARAREAATAG